MPKIYFVRLSPWLVALVLLVGTLGASLPASAAGVGGRAHVEWRVPTLTGVPGVLNCNIDATRPIDRTVWVGVEPGKRLLPGDSTTVTIGVKAAPPARNQPILPVDRPRVVLQTAGGATIISFAGYRVGTTSIPLAVSRLTAGGDFTTFDLQITVPADYDRRRGVDSEQRDVFIGRIGGRIYVKDAGGFLVAPLNVRVCISPRNDLTDPVRAKDRPKIKPTTEVNLRESSSLIPAQTAFFSPRWMVVAASGDGALATRRTNMTWFNGTSSQWNLTGARCANPPSRRPLVSDADPPCAPDPALVSPVPCPASPGLPYTIGRVDCDDRGRVLAFDAGTLNPSDWFGLRWNNSDPRDPLWYEITAVRNDGLVMTSHIIVR